MWKRTLKVLLLLLVFLCIHSVAQDPKTEKQKKKQQELDHIVRDTSTYIVTRAPDSLLLEQRSINLKLDSLLKEKSKK